MKPTSVKQVSDYEAMAKLLDLDWLACEIDHDLREGKEERIRWNNRAMILMLQKVRNLEAELASLRKERDELLAMVSDECEKCGFTPECGITQDGCVGCEIARLREELAMWKPLTTEEAQAAYEAAEAVPMSDDDVQKIVDRVMDHAERMSNRDEATLVATLRKSWKQRDALEAANTRLREANKKLVPMNADLKEILAKGDYVLATKYSDGDPGDHFVIGFYDGKDGDRHHVVDSRGQRFRANGFRRCEKISGEVGAWLLARLDEIEAQPFYHDDDGALVGKSVWHWKDDAVSLVNAAAERAGEEGRVGT